MPLPKPTDGESRDDFISRCMGNDIMNRDFPDNDQRMAVCQRQWEDNKMNTKSFQPDLKLKETGEFEAVFATLNVIDKDGDVIVPGAIESGTKVRVSAYNHSSWSGALPVGKGQIFEENEQLIVRGQFFMDTDGGQETYKTVKNLEDLGEWSFGFDRVIQEPGEWNDQRVNILRKMKVHEVSPVLLGAGIGTRTMVMKKAVRNHKTSVVEEKWSANANVTRLDNDAPASVYRNVFAWEPQEDKEDKSKWKFPHHMVSENGEPGAANYRACVAAIASLNGARGGADIPSDDRQSTYDHVAKHIRDHGKEPPELKLAVNLTLASHAVVVAEECRGLSERAQEIFLDRKDKTKKVAEKSEFWLKYALYEAEEVVANLKGLLQEPIMPEEIDSLRMIKLKMEVEYADERIG
jgi:hypothetical protein